MNGKTLTVLACMALPALSATAGCTPESHSTDTPASSTSAVSNLTSLDLPTELSQEATDMALVSRPLHSVVEGAKEDELALIAAKQRGIQECMAKRGFDYEIRPAVGRSNSLFRIPFGDVEYAQSHGELGHRVDRTSESGRNSNRSDTYADDTAPPSEKQESDEFYQALTGDPFGPTAKVITTKRGTTRYDSASCVAIGESSVVGDLFAYDSSYKAVENLANDLYTAIENSAQWRALESRWSSCMSSKGYTFENSLAAHEKHSEISVKPNEGKPSDEQRKLAIAVTTCERKVNAAGHYKALVKHAEDTAGPEAESIINTYRELRTKAFARAKELNTAN